MAKPIGTAADLSDAGRTRTSPQTLHMAKEPFSGHADVVKVFAHAMTGFVIYNDGSEPLFFTIAGDTFTVREGERFEERFEPFRQVVVASKGPFRAYGRQAVPGLGKREIAASAAALVGKTAPFAATKESSSVLPGNGSGEAKTAALAPGQSSLLFALDFRNRMGMRNDTICDKVSGASCRLEHANEDGPDGYADNRGLVLTKHSSVYIDTHKKPLYGKIDLNEGVVIELWLYHPYGILLGSEPSDLIVGLAGGTCCKIPYIAAEGVAPEQGAKRQSRRTLQWGEQEEDQLGVRFHSSDMLNAVTACIGADGSRRWFVNGLLALDCVPPPRFERFANPHHLYPLRLRCANDCADSGHTTIASLSIYRGVQSAAEIGERYRLSQIRKAPGEVVALSP